MEGYFQTFPIKPLCERTQSSPSFLGSSISSTVTFTKGFQMRFPKDLMLPTEFNINPTLQLEGWQGKGSSLIVSSSASCTVTMQIGQEHVLARFY